MFSYGICGLYFNGDFFFVNQYNGDLFLLETDEHILSSVHSAMWKKLTVVCDVIFCLGNLLEFRIVLQFDIFVPMQMIGRN